MYQVPGMTVISEQPRPMLDMQLVRSRSSSAITAAAALLLGEMTGPVSGHGTTLSQQRKVPGEVNGGKMVAAARVYTRGG